MSVSLSKGIIYMATMSSSTGLPSAPFQDVGEGEGLDLLFEQQRVQKYSSRSCVSNLIADIRTRITPSARIRFSENTAANIRRFLQGTAVSVAATPIAAETIPGTAIAPAVGDYLFLKHPITTMTTLKDSAGSPDTLVLDTEYSVYDAAGGILKILVSPSGNTMPLVAAYTPVAHTSNKLFSDGEKDYCVRYSGINCVTNDHENWELYQLRLSPPSEWQIQGAEEFAQYESSSPLIFNQARYDVAGALYGGYARQLAYTPA